MDIIRRPPTDEERRALVPSRSFLGRLLRPARDESRTPAEVEVLRFRVLRAWKGTTCSGPPCCPNTWLLEAPDQVFVWMQSWTVLAAVDGQFPGRDVTLVRESEGSGILTASAAGPPAPTRQGGDSLIDFESPHEVEIYQREALPDLLARALDV